MGPRHRHDAGSTDDATWAASRPSLSAPDGRIAFTASFDQTARLWDLATGSARGHTLTGHDGPIMALAVSPVGPLAATASFDRTARLWDAVLGLPVGPPLVHPERAISVEFSSDGATLLTTCEDGIAQLWAIARSDRVSEHDPIGPAR